MSKQEMDSAIDFLSSEGHIYSTVDDEHYRTTDED
jgi:replication factor A2